jgi:hypothetical protein
LPGEADLELAPREALLVNGGDEMTIREDGRTRVVAVPDAEDDQKRTMAENDIVLARSEKSKPAFTSKRWLGATPPPKE